MKRALILIYVLSISVAGLTQNYFSTFLTGNDYVRNGGLTQFDNRTIIAASETCNGFGGIGCTYLLEVMNDNSISYLFEVGELTLNDKSIISNENRLTIVGMNENNSMKLFQFDNSLDLVNEVILEISGSGSSWIFDIIEYEEYYVVAEYRFGTDGENYPTLYWFDVNDLSLQGKYTIEENVTTLQELTIDNNDNLRVFKYKDGQNEILTFNTSMELIQEWKVQESGHISYINFEITRDGSTVFGLYQKKKLLSYDNQGQLKWELDIAAAFDLTEVGIRELKEISNGDILLCGSLKKEDLYYGFIYMLNNNGVEKWKRIYKLDNSKSTNPLKGFVELNNEGLLFYGTTRFESFPSSNSFHDTHWVLKTDYNGCITTGCGDELIANNTEIDLSTPIIYPNPTSSIIRLVYEKKG